MPLPIRQPLGGFNEKRYAAKMGGVEKFAKGKSLTLYRRNEETD